MNWYYVKNGQQAGPVNDEQLQQLTGSGEVNASTLVWHDGMKDWVAFGTLGQIAAASTPPQTPGQAQTPASGNAPCRVCQRTFPVSEMVPYSNTYVCPSCKTDFFQRLQEGAGMSDGNTPNGELMSQAREALRGNWGTAIGTALLMMVISTGVQLVPLFGGLLSLLLSGSLTLGFSMFLLALVRRQDARTGMLFDGFQRFGPALGAYFLMNLFILLWALLLIIPGIMAAMSYSMTFFVMADNPDIGPMEAIKRSKKMMHGKRWKLFCLGLRFIGWSLLSILTLFIGFLWVMPYYWTSATLFYEDVKGRVAE